MGLLTLTQCKQMAIEHNAKLQNAQIGIQQARQQEQEALAKFFPSLSLAGLHFRAVDGLIKTEMNGMPIEELDKGTMAMLSATQPLYAGGQIINGNRLAKLQTEIRQLQLSQTRQEILQQTENYYYQLFVLQKKTRTLDAAEQQLSSIHHDAELAWRAGMANKSDMLSVELEQNRLAARRMELWQGIALCRLVLAQYIGLYGSSDIEIDTTLIADIKAPETYLINHEEALDNRPEAGLLDSQVETARLQKRLAQGALLPTVSIGASAYTNDLTDKWRQNLMVMVTVSVPISAWWDGSHNVKRQQMAHRQAEISRRDNRELMVIGMQSAYNDLDVAYRRIALAQKSIETTEEKLRLSQDYYRSGTTTMSDLLDARTQWQTAQDDLIQQQANYLMKRTEYLRQTGRME